MPFNLYMNPIITKNTWRGGMANLSRCERPSRGSTQGHSLWYRDRTDRARDCRWFFCSLPIVTHNGQHGIKIVSSSLHSLCHPAKVRPSLLPWPRHSPRGPWIWLGVMSSNRNVLTLVVLLRCWEYRRVSWSRTMFSFQIGWIEGVLHGVRV